MLGLCILVLDPLHAPLAFAMLLLAYGTVDVEI